MTDRKKIPADHEGTCLCGTVRVTLHGLKPDIDICHCSMCRQWGGGPFMGIGAESFTMSGEDTICVFASSDWAERAFCSKCGSHLWFRFTPTDHYGFLAGMFDAGPNARIEQQIFVDEKPAFYDFAQQTIMKTGAQIIAEAEAEGLSFGD